MHKQWKADFIILVIFVILSIGLFFLIDLFTLTYKKGGPISGNGNLGMLFVAPAIPVYLIMLGYVYKISRSYFQAREQITIFPIILLPLLMICLYGEYRFVQSLIHHLGGGTNTSGSVIYNWPWLNQYTNTLFFNLYTFSIGVLLTLLISLGVEFYKRCFRKNCCDLVK